MPGPMRREMRALLLSCLGIAALASGTALARLAPSRAAGEPPALAAPSQPGHGPILVQMFRGQMLASEQEVSITTIFRAPTFAVLADAELTEGTEEALMAQVRDTFSLREMTSLGSSLVSPEGGSAILDDNGRRFEIRIQAEPVGSRARRLVVSAIQQGVEVVATSVIARAGRTIVLAGPAGPSRPHQEIDFICLTLLD